MFVQTHTEVFCYNDMLNLTAVKDFFNIHHQEKDTSRHNRGRATTLIVLSMSCETQLADPVKIAIPVWRQAPPAGLPAAPRASGPFLSCAFPSRGYVPRRQQTPRRGGCST